MKNLEWNDQKKEMEEMLKMYEKIESDILKIKSKGYAWSYVGSKLCTTFYDDIKEIKQAIEDAKHNLTV